jgi:hypothetical protein
MTEGYGDGRMALVGGQIPIPAIAQLEVRVGEIERLLVALHASFERIEAGMTVLLSEVRDLG